MSFQNLDHIFEDFETHSLSEESSKNEGLPILPYKIRVFLHAIYYDILNILLTGNIIQLFQHDIVSKIRCFHFYQ